MSYQKPLLVEIYTELHLAPEQLLPEQFFSLVPALSDIVPTVELGQVGAVSLGSGAVVQVSTPRIRCWSTDRTKLVQLSPALLIVNQVEPYLGWAQFADLFGEVQRRASTVLGALLVASISLNTIDRLTVPARDFRFGHYFLCGGKFIPGWYENAREPLDISLGHGVLAVNGFNRQVGVTVRMVESEQMETQVTCTFHDRLENEQPAKRLEQLHEESNSTFESLITNATRDLMGRA